MNPFKQQLLAAKKKQRLLYISMSAFFFLGIIIVLAVILISRGTRVEIKPDDAVELSTIQLDKGVAVLVADTLYSISKKPLITVSAEGFYNTSQELNANDFGKVMTVTLKPRPAKIIIKTNNTDDKTNWNINGKLIDIAKVFEHELAAGEYEVSVTHAHYQNAKMNLSLSRGEVFEQNIELLPIAGQLTINTTPSGAYVSIDDVDMGKTPFSLPIQGGFHHVSITHASYANINETIEVSRKMSEVRRDYQLQLKKAVVAVSLKPEGGKLSMDGIVVKDPKSISVTAGMPHQFTYSKAGYFAQSKRVNIKAEDTLELGFELEKEMGLVEIISAPAAAVEVNGKYIGITPLQLSLNAIEQKIVLSKTGYRSVTKTVSPSSSSKKKISVSLVTEKAARLKEAKNSYTNKAGGKLTLFKPNDTFTMGAKRHEVGQRANEFIKKIKLNKPFYAGVYEVTNAEFNQFRKKSNAGPKMPVTSVSWFEAVEFCNWLSQQEGLIPVYLIEGGRVTTINTKADGYRLLTEAEWEWLARKSGKKQQSLFVWGDETIIPKNAVNIADESAKGKVKLYVPKYHDRFVGPAPIGSLAQEKSGLYDQGGNVSEWVHDSYSIAKPESGKVFQDPLSRASGRSHVIKGANWRSSSITELRPSYREGLEGSRDDLGFRLGRYVYGGD